MHGATAKPPRVCAVFLLPLLDMNPTTGQTNHSLHAFLTESSTALWKMLQLTWFSRVSVRRLRYDDPLPLTRHTIVRAPTSQPLAYGWWKLNHHCGSSPQADGYESSAHFLGFFFFFQQSIRSITHYTQACVTRSTRCWWLSVHNAEQSRVMMITHVLGERFIDEQ